VRLREELGEGHTHEPHDAVGPHPILAEVRLVKADRLKLLDLPVRCVVVASAGVPARERVDEGVHGSIDRRVRRAAQREHTELERPLLLCGRRQSERDRNRRLFVHDRAPRAVPRTQARRVPHHLLRVAIEVRQIEDHRAEPSRVLVTHDGTACIGGEPRRSSGLAEGGDVDPFCRHRARRT
jgi:hypothetical protein